MQKILGKIIPPRSPKFASFSNAYINQFTDIVKFALLVRYKEICLDKHLDGIWVMLRESKDYGLSTLIQKNTQAKKVF